MLCFLSLAVLSPFIFSVAMENFFGAVPASVAISAAETISRQISGAASVNAVKFYGILVRISAAAAAVASNCSSASIFLPILLNQVRFNSQAKSGQGRRPSVRGN